MTKFILYYNKYTFQCKESHTDITYNELFPTRMQEYRSQLYSETSNKRLTHVTQQNYSWTPYNLKLLILDIPLT